jgi:hypothetical protein
MEKNLVAMIEVNNASVELNAFTEQFVARTVLGAVSSLRGAESIRDLELRVERGEVTAMVNGNEIPITPFPSDIISGTIKGMVSTLKGMGKIDSVKITVKAE